jgi:hypothetical protein
VVRAQLGSEPRDGKRSAIIGTLHGYGELTSPFARERCAAYSYEIVTTDTIDGETQTRKAYEGFAMVPLSIEHGTERTRILAKPALPSLSAKHPRSKTQHANAKLFVENTTFTPAPATTADEKDLSHTDGHLRVDYSRNPIETNIGACQLVEKILPGETSACAVGTYRADRRALVAPVTLRTGSSFATGAAWSIVRAAIATAICVVIGSVIVAAFCVNFPIDAAEQLNPKRTLAWWEIDFDRFVHARVRQAGIPLSGYYLQPVCDGCAKGRLEIDGQIIELRHARYIGNRSVHLSANPGDRDGVTLNYHDEVALTLNGKTARIPPSWIQPGDINTSLGSHGDYAGRVTVIAPDRSIRCRVSFQIQSQASDWY